MATKKLGAAATFGARYGVSVKRSWLKVHKPQKAKHDCPSCGFPKVVRLDRGIFFCKKCEIKFTGGTYLPKTLTGSIIKKMVEQKSFMPMVAQLIESKEKVEANVKEHAAAVEDAEKAKGKESGKTAHSIETEKEEHSKLHGKKVDE